MPLQNFFLVLLVPIVLHEIITAYTMNIPQSKRGTYKATTWFSLFVVIQLIFLVYEELLVQHVFQCSIWILLFLFYGPFLNRIISTIQQEKLEESKTYHISEFYYMIYVFIFGLFLSLVKPKWAYVDESIGALLGIIFLYYGILLRKKIKILMATSSRDASKLKKKKRFILHLGLGMLLVVFFYFLSKEIKLSVFLLLLLVYVYLTFIRKNMDAEPFYAAVLREENEGKRDDEERLTNAISEEKQKDRSELLTLKYGQTKLNDVVLQRCKVKVNQIIIEDKAYLDANFKMTDLAAKTKISRYYLAQYFNVVFKMNFREYINKLRIEHVVEHILNHQAKEELSVHDLFLESAFNSKTSFFKSFKHVLGCTPFEYLKKCQ